MLSRSLRALTVVATHVVLPAACGIAIAIVLAGVSGRNGPRQAVAMNSAALATQLPDPGPSPGGLRGGIADRALVPDEDPPIRLARAALGEGWFVTRLASDGSVGENVGTYGSLYELPYFRFVVSRNEGHGDDGLFPEISRRAAETGAGVTRLSSPQPMPTRFGTATIGLAELEDAEDRRATCRVFRLVQNDLEIGLSGWLCDAADAETQPERLLCLIDGLTLSSTVEHLPLRVAFREASQRPSSCPTQPAAMATFARSAGIVPGAEAVGFLSSERPLQQRKPKWATREPKASEKLRRRKTSEATASISKQSEIRR